MGIFIAAFLVLFFMEIPEPNIEQITTELPAKKYGALSYRHFVFGIIAIFIYSELKSAFLSNLFMTTDFDIDPTTAGTVVGTYWFLMLIGRLIGASVEPKVSSKTMLTFTTSVALILVLLAIFCPEVQK